MKIKVKNLKYFEFMLIREESNRIDWIILSIIISVAACTIAVIYKNLFYVDAPPDIDWIGALGYLTMFTVLLTRIVYRIRKNKYYDKEDNFYLELQVNKKIKYAIEQYLLLFNEYIVVTKGENIKLSISETKNGIMISTSVNSKITENVFTEWIDEYLNILRLKSDDIKINTSKSVDSNKIDFLILKLKNQIGHLKQSIEILNLENKMLTKHNKLVEEIIIKYLDKNISIKKSNTN